MPDILGADRKKGISRAARPRRTGNAGAIVVALAALVVAAELATGVRRLQAQDSAAPAASTTELMQAMIIPASSAIFDVPRNPPADDDGWTRLRDASVVLAESGTLLMRAGRAQDSEVWKSTSKELADAGEVALRAVRQRDVEALADVGNLLIDSCEVCHEKHWIR